MAINLSDNILSQTTAPGDAKYGPYTGANLSAALSAATTYLLPSYRYEGLTIGIIVNTDPIVEYWFYDGVANGNLVLKGGGYLTASALVPYLTTASASTTYYSLTNPSGYITASALVPYLTTASASTPFYNKGGSTYSFDTTTSIYRTGSLSIGTGSVNSNDRFVVSSSGGTVSLIVDEFGNVYNRGRGNVSTNTAFGASALSLNVGGYENTAIGVNALLSNTSGSFNTAIGQDSLRLSISGGSNTAIGDSVLYSNTTGDVNTAIGRDALYFNITGDSNIALGSNAGKYTSLISGATNSNNSIFIGSDTRPQLDNQTNQIVIGHGATGNGSNTINLGNDSIVATYLKGSVYIGTRGGGTVSLVVDEFGNVYNNGNGGIATNTAFGENALSLNTTGYQNTAIGVNALLNNTTGIYNTAIGAQALKLNTGSRNTAVGFESLSSNISGTYNTAVGFETLKRNISGTNTAVGGQALFGNKEGTANVAIGVQSLFSSINGSYNTAIGHNSLYSNTTGVILSNLFSSGTGYQDGTYDNVTLVYVTGSSFLTAPIVTIGISGGGVSFVNVLNPGTGFFDTTTIFTISSYGTYSVGSGFEIGMIGLSSGDYNTAIGHSSLYNNNSGSNNIAIGYQTLYANTQGTGNIAIGFQSLYFNTSGVYNTSLGISALRNNTTGDQNTAFGQETLYNNTIGNSNVAIGVYTLYNNNSGSNNIALGYYAAQYTSSGSGLTNSNNSIFIGSNTRASVANNTNEIVIGNSAIGNGSNSVTLGNDNIIKTILKGNVGIGLTGPSTKLHIFATQSGAFRLVDGTQGPGYVLTSDANGVARWATASTGSTGSVTNVTGLAPITVTSNTTTPVISVANASGTQSGVITIGNQTIAGAKTFTSAVSVGDTTTIVYSSINQNSIDIHNGNDTTIGWIRHESNGFTRFKGSVLTNFVVVDPIASTQINLPAKPAGVYTIAMLEDITSGTVTNVTGTFPISVATNTTTPVISVANASGTQSGVITIGTQTIAGAKTFTNDLSINSPLLSIRLYN